MDTCVPCVPCVPCVTQKTFKFLGHSQRRKFTRAGQRRGGTAETIHPELTRACYPRGGAAAGVAASRKSLLRQSRAIVAEVARISIGGHGQHMGRSVQVSAVAYGGACVSRGHGSFEGAQHINKTITKNEHKKDTGVLDFLSAFLSLILSAGFVHRLVRRFVSGVCPPFGPPFCQWFCQP